MKKNLLKRDGVQSLIASLLCVVLGLLIGYIVLLIINPAGAGEAITTVIKNFLTYKKPETQMKYFGNTLVRTAPLLMCSLSILFAYKAGLFNIGAAGQYCAGAGMALYAALAWHMPWWLCMIMAMLGGALLGTSEHSMIGKFIDQILPEESLPQTLTSYSPCFRKEKGAHGIEERGIYRIHQFEKQEMIVVCKPEESKAWYEQLWQYSVELFRSLDIPVRQLECCSGDLADLKCKSCDIEAWSPRQQKYFEVCSCSNLGDAQARRLKIRYKDKDGKMQLCHTLNNTCVAPPRMLIAFLENNLQADGTVLIPKVLQPYMGGCERLVPKH